MDFMPARKLSYFHKIRPFVVEAPILMVELLVDVSGGGQGTPCQEKSRS
jgi:hypothetical protein